MIVLSGGTGDLIKVNLDVGSSDIAVDISGIDWSSGVGTRFGDAIASITGSGDTTILTGATSTQRELKNISIRNNHASTTTLVKVSHNDGSQTASIIQATLLAGETLVYSQAGNWTHHDTNGGIYAGFPVATQTDMEAGTSLITVVTPGRQHLHPSAAKFWVVFTGNSTTILASYNMTSISDGTSEATVTIATDFSSANWCCHANGEGTTSSAVANARSPTSRSIAAGSIIVFCIDGAATPVIQDPTRWHVSGFGDQ